MSLLPEGWLESVLKDKDERAALRSGKRYMSNITIVERQSELAALPRDVLLTGLNEHSKDGVFTGTYAGPGRGASGAPARPTVPACRGRSLPGGKSDAG